MRDLVKYLQLGLLGIILVSTIIAVVLEIKLMFINTSVTLADLLLMFLYLEVLASTSRYRNIKSKSARVTDVFMNISLISKTTAMIVLTKIIPSKPSCKYFTRSLIQF